jgi:hypothetical protein
LASREALGDSKRRSQKFNRALVDIQLFVAQHAGLSAGRAHDVLRHWRGDEDEDEDEDEDGLTNYGHALAAPARSAGMRLPGEK